MQLLALPLNEADESRLPAWTEALDRDTVARADRFRFAPDRTRFIAAHALLRTALAAALGRRPSQLAFALGPHGKPFLADTPGPHFNLTHTPGLAALALHAVPVGCDAEPTARRVTEAVFPVMAEEEAQWLRTLRTPAERQAAFIQLWVLKEAFTKSLGLGFALSPKSYAFDISRGRIDLARMPARYADGPGWQFALDRIGTSHVIALAAERSPGLPSLPAPRILDPALPLAAQIPG